MGVKTAAEIIKEGVELAGVTYDVNDANPLSWLKQWLESVALGWPWPETMDSVTVNLLAGTRVTLLGDTAPIATSKRILRVNFPLEIMYGPNVLPDKIYQEAYSASYDVFDVPDSNPTKASYAHNIPGIGAGIVFNAKPKTTIRIHVPYQFDPVVYFNTIADYPWYQNDETMIHAVAYKAAKYADGPDAQTTAAFANDLSTMVRNDKLKFGVIDSFVLKMNRNPRMR